MCKRKRCLQKLLQLSQHVLKRKEGMVWPLPMLISSCPLYSAYPLNASMWTSVSFPTLYDQIIIFCFPASLLTIWNLSLAGTFCLHQVRRISQWPRFEGFSGTLANWADSRSLVLQQLCIFSCIPRLYSHISGLLYVAVAWILGWSLLRESSLLPLAGFAILLLPLPSHSRFPFLLRLIYQSLC